MATLEQKMRMAFEVFGREPVQGEQRIYAIATAPSSGGTVAVDIGGEEVDVPVVGAVARGQEVLLQVQNGHPVAIGVAGWGDNLTQRVRVVEDVLSYVWLDEFGQLHVTAYPQGTEPNYGVLINSSGMAVEGYTYTSETGDDGFTVYLGASPVLQVIADAQSPDFQHNRLRSVDTLYLEADSGGDTPAHRTRLHIADTDTAATYYANDVARLDVDGVSAWAAGKNAAGYYLGSDRGDSRIYAGRGTFNNHVSTFYGTCSTAAATQAKAVDCPEFTADDLAEGVRLLVRFTTAQTYNGQPTLNVNSTGAVSVVRQGTTAGMRYMWQAGECVEFVYNGSAWLAVDGSIATTTYYGVTKLSSSVSSTSASTAATPAAVKQAYDLAAAGGTDTGWLELVAPSLTSSGVHYRAVGSYCTITADGTYTTTTASGWQTVGQLPADYRPTGSPHALRFVWYDHARSEFRRGQVTVGGNVQLHQSGTADGCEFTFTFPIG